jgi:L,D-peptidoglycan transpeptidase YkuD (ErfK/YbiS/YcfS/YnhG family)
MDIYVSSDGLRMPDGRMFKCALGRSGITHDKREDDGATPAGTWPVRRLYYRADRLAPPETQLPIQAIREDDGWIDQPDHPGYNTRVTLPLPEGISHERLWLDSHLYDLIVALGYNDDPPVPGKGSAIFMHVARPDYGPTAGCVALSLNDLQHVIKELAPGDRIVVE